MNFNWITLSNNEWSNATFVHHGTKVYIRLDGILSGIYYFGSGSQCQSGLVISKDQHTPRIMQPLRPFHHDSVDSASANFGFLRLGDRPRPLYPPQDSYNPPARTTQCIQRRENYFMRNSRWNCIYGEPVAGFVVDSCCNCLIYMKIGNSREPTYVWRNKSATLHDYFA